MSLTIYTDAVYAVAAQGQTGWFTLSSTNNEVVLLSAGSLGGSAVIGIAYNQVDVTAGTTTTNSGQISALHAPVTVTLQPYVNGVHYGSDAPTTFQTSVSGSGGINYALLLANNVNINFEITGQTTASIDLSAGEYDISDKDARRLWNLGIT